MDNVNCTGSESSLDQCKYSTQINCSHNEDVIVTCSYEANFTQDFIYRNGKKLGWRLANPTNISLNGSFLGVTGRAEYYQDNKWN